VLLLVGLSEIPFKEGKMSFPHGKARIKKMRVTPQHPAIEIKVTGARDPRGPDNSVFIWLEDDDTLHISVYKANRCYQFREVIDHGGAIEIVQE
jgi:hypothetical protein